MSCLLTLPTTHPCPCPTNFRNAIKMHIDYYPASQITWLDFGCILAILTENFKVKYLIIHILRKVGPTDIKNGSMNHLWWFSTHWGSDKFADIFQMTLKMDFLGFENENVWISIKILLKIVPRGPINNIPALVQIMALTRRKAFIWTNDGYFTDVYMHHSAPMS